MTLTLVAYILFLHFVADFLLQSRKMGREKSEKPEVLLQHISIQFAVIALGLWPFIGNLAFEISFYNAIIHGVIDWNIWKFYKLSVYKRLSKMNKEEAICDSPIEWIMVQGMNPHELAMHFAPKWKYWEDHWFYSTIGLDQLLHALTILACVGFLT